MPHGEVLPHASLVVTHAGLGTVMSALSHGVPLLCLPLGRDQFFNAAMVERLGAGRVLPAMPTGATLAAAVHELLADDGTRAGAKRMATVIAGYAGAATAVAELERVGSPSAFVGRLEGVAEAEPLRRRRERRAPPASRTFRPAASDERAK